MSEITLETLSAKLDGLQASHDALVAENAKLKGSIISITDKPQLPTIPPEVLELGGKKYKWQVAQFTLPGKEPKTLTAEEASVDEDILKAVLEIDGQGILKEQV